MDQAEALARGYAFLRRLEQRIRVVHGDGSHLVEADATGLVPLARRMGLRDRPGKAATEVLMERYRQASEGIHACYRGTVVASLQA